MLVLIYLGKSQAMHWWQSAFSSVYSTSSSSSAKVHSDDSLIVSGGGGCALRGAFFFGRSRRHATKRHHLTDQDIDTCVPVRKSSSCDNSPARISSSSSGTQPSPMPLPLPELQTLIRQVSHSSTDSCSIPLPSPEDSIPNPKDRDVKRDKTDSHPSVNCDGQGEGALSLQRSLNQAARKNTGNPESQARCRKSPGEPIGTRRTTELKIPAAISAPSSPYASPSHSPLNHASYHSSPKFYTPPTFFQGWSASEMPHSADHTLGFPCQLSPDKMAFSSDNSPHHSPSRPASPSLNILPNETSMLRRDSGSQSNVHPLPRPPSAAAPSPQPSPSPSLPVSPMQELMPIKGQWQKGKLIGRGTFGSVYVASNRETGALCAMKEVELLPDDPKSAECMRQLQQEIKVLSNLKHPNIVQYYGSEIAGDSFYIYLEYVHPGSINKFIRDHCGAITESVVRNFTRHILCGLAYLHGTKTIHRDIKGANLLVDAYGVVKLADFGMSKHLSGQAGYLSLKGSPYWMAPELMQLGAQDNSNSDYAFAIDIWSLGCTIIEMMNGKPPWSEYEGPAAMFKVLKETPPIPDSLSPEGKDFLQCCFRRNPAERPTASMLLEHRFVKNLYQQLSLPQCVRPLNGLILTDNLLLKRENKNELSAKEVLMNPRSESPFSSSSFCISGST
ncbi:PREDICTED: mitogen-activated protein kinase kinase kinase YODA-like [Ipomoea nil]|uniref:mitogen-activated protein kinase kinase kinase YODA-like n=1 Tax=Ipomoea nil TaxID=35883 RepID=UPI0009017AA1|nr:PREDICTED: mitogen-activated protein kinase kinase kinase YODA-like [Ipomoea nil]